MTLSEIILVEFQIAPNLFPNSAFNVHALCSRCVMHSNSLRKQFVRQRMLTPDRFEAHWLYGPSQRGILIFFESAGTCQQCTSSARSTGPSQCPTSSTSGLRRSLKTWTSLCWGWSSIFRCSILGCCGRHSRLKRRQRLIFTGRRVCVSHRRRCVMSRRADSIVSTA